MRDLRQKPVGRICPQFHLWARKDKTSEDRTLLTIVGPNWNRSGYSSTECSFSELVDLHLLVQGDLLSQAPLRCFRREA